MVALLEYPNAIAGDLSSLLVTILGFIIETVTFSGSMIAYGKLDGKVGDIMKPYRPISTYLRDCYACVGAFVVVSPTPAEMLWSVYIF